MNIALIFAGGVGTRMNAKAKPKQFLELHGKPIILYTLEVFEHHPEIDQIVIVCVEDYIEQLKTLIRRFELRKVSIITAGGKTGFESIYNGLAAIESSANADDVVLIHDGVRPFIDDALISANIKGVKEYGNAITSVPVTEGVMVSSDAKTVDSFLDRASLYTTKAPQSFRFGDIFQLYKRAMQDGFVPIESAHLCQHYGVRLHRVEGSSNNIKITTPTDFFIFRAIHDAIENSQLVGF